MKINKLLLIAFLLTGFFFSFVFAEDKKEEQITITTYYPSPYGNYFELRAQRLAVGENFSDPGVYTWLGQITGDADLVVEGRVGIGIGKPATQLHIGDPSYPDTGLAGGARNWMTHGMIVSWDSDNLFLGLRDAGPNRKDTVLAWGDGPGLTGNALRFIFSPSETYSPTGPDVTSVEVMRMVYDGTHPRVLIGSENTATPPQALLEVRGENQTIMLPTTTGAAVEPTCNNGAIYYNGDTNRMRVCENGVWRNIGEPEPWTFDERRFIDNEQFSDLDDFEEPWPWKDSIPLPVGVDEQVVGVELQVTERIDGTDWIDVGSVFRLIPETGFQSGWYGEGGYIQFSAYLRPDGKGASIYCRGDDWSANTGGVKVDIYFLIRKL